MVSTSGGLCPRLCWRSAGNDSSESWSSFPLPVSLHPTEVQTWTACSEQCIGGLEVNKHKTKHICFEFFSWARCMLAQWESLSPLPLWCLWIAKPGGCKVAPVWVVLNACVWFVPWCEAKINLQAIIVHFRGERRRQWKAMKDWVYITVHKWY